MNLPLRRRSVAASLVLLPLLSACGGLLPKPPERQVYRYDRMNGTLKRLGTVETLLR